MKQFRPLLAADASEEDVVFPVYASPKIDGIRCLIRNGEAVSRALKPIPNRYIRKCLELHADRLNGFDGELTVGDGFNSSTSSIMSHGGEPDFTYHVFDIEGILTYQHRLRELRLKTAETAVKPMPPFVKRLKQSLIISRGDLQNYYSECLEQGHEGVIVRSVDGEYKYGRSTIKQGIMLKLKPFDDSEAMIVGFKELMHNDNEKTTSEIGLSKRSSKQEGKRGANTLGKFVVVGLQDGHFKDVEFKIGTGQGLTQELRKHIWQRQEYYTGKIVKFKYQKIGSIDKPRIPIFLGFRDRRDM